MRVVNGSYGIPSEVFAGVDCKRWSSLPDDWLVWANCLGDTDTIPVVHDGRLD